MSPSRPTVPTSKKSLSPALGELPLRMPSDASDQANAGRAPERLNRTSYVPLYYQLVLILEERIAAGHWGAGDRFPSEQELCDRFGVSRAVVRPAIAILETEGRLERIKGRGTFVRAHKATLEIGGLTRMLAGAGPPGGFSLRVLESQPSRSERRVVALLAPPRGETVLRVTALVASEEGPRAMYSSFITSGVARRAGLDREGLVAAGGDGVPPLASQEVLVETSWCMDFEADQLGLQAGAPVLMARCIERVESGARRGRAIEVAWVVYRGDLVRLGRLG